VTDPTGGEAEVERVISDAYPGFLFHYYSLAIMMGWGVTFLLVGRVAFRQESQELKRALLTGLAVWPAVEAAGSAWFGVWFNVGVDAGVLLLFAIPLLALPRLRRERSRSAAAR
jgi:hypothetical protein